MTKNQLVILKTHLINKGIINEYCKLREFGYDTILFFVEKIMQADKAVFSCELYDESVDCFYTDEKIYRDLHLPFWDDTGNSNNFSNAISYNSDYCMYLIRQRFNNYEYYWQFDCRTYMNSPIYAPFFVKYLSDQADLLITCYSDAPDSWVWKAKTDWVYRDIKKYSCLYSIARFSARALDFLCSKRQEHHTVFKNLLHSKIDHGNIRWIHCELFVPTELVNNSFVCKGISGHKIAFRPKYANEFYNKKLWYHPDNLIYYPITNWDFA